MDDEKVGDVVEMNKKEYIVTNTFVQEGVRFVILARDKVER